MITAHVADALGRGEILFHRTERDSQGRPARCRVNGKCKLWVTRPNDFKLPVIHGLYNYFYITPQNADRWCLTEAEAMEPEDS